MIAGGTGRDLLWGGRGDDTFVFNEGDGRDSIRDFNNAGDDAVLLNVAGINDFDDLLASVSRSTANVTTFNFGDGDILQVVENVDNLTADDFIFV